MTIVVTILLIPIILFLALGFWRMHVRTHKFTFSTWHELAGRLQPVQSKGITTLALDYLQPAATQVKRQPDEVMDLVGGAKGLADMNNNAEIFIALASYAQRWNKDESVIAVERMQQDGLALRRATVGLGIGKTCGYGKKRVSVYVHEAASSYYLMRQRLLALYKNSHAGLYPVLGDTE